VVPAGSNMIKVVSLLRDDSTRLKMICYELDPLFVSLTFLALAGGSWCRIAVEMLLLDCSNDRQKVTEASLSVFRDRPSGQVPFYQFRTCLSNLSVGHPSF
jgi:hypothetical protein